MLDPEKPKKHKGISCRTISVKPLPSCGGVLGGVGFIFIDACATSGGALKSALTAHFGLKTGVKVLSVGNLRETWFNPRTKDN